VNGELARPQRRGSPIVVSLPEMVVGWETCKKLAQTPAHVVPGHDPDVMNRYPTVPWAEGVAVRLDVDPSDPLP